MLNVGLAALEPSIARDLAVFNLSETSGNVWLATLEPER
jgi:hypothetical protein